MSEGEALEPAPAPAAGDPVVVEDAQGQQWHVDAAELSQYVRSGQYQIAPDQYQTNPGQGIPVYREGKLGYLPSTEADAAIRSFDADAAPSGAVAADEERRHWQGGLQQARAASAGWLRGIPGSDWALTQIDPTLAPELSALKQYNPGISTGFELAGTVATAGMLPGRAISGAAGLAGRGASGLGRLAGAAEGGFAARALGAAARTGVEFGAFEANQELSRQTLAQQQLDGEKIALAFGHGAVLGGALGGAGSLAWSAGRGVAGMAGDAVLGAGRSVVEKGRELGNRAVEAGGALVERGRAAAESGIEQGKAAVELGLERGKTAVEGGVERLKASGALEKLGREQAIKSTGANLKQVEALRAMGPEAEERAVRLILDAQTDTAGKLLDRAAMAEKAAARVEAEGQQVRKLVDEMHAAGVKTDMRAFVREQRAQVVAKLEGKIDPDLEKAVKQVDDWYDKLHSANGDPRTVWETKHTLGSRIDWKAGTDNVANELKKDLYFGLDRKITEMGVESAEKMGAGFEKTWRAANNEYRVARWVGEATEKGASSELRNNTFGMGEYAAGLGMAALTGGPLGIPVALAGMAAKNLSRRYGSQAVSQALLRPGSVDAMVAQVDARLGGSVRTYLSQAKDVALPALGRAKRAAVGAVEGARGAAERAAADAGAAAGRAVDATGAAVGRAVDATVGAAEATGRTVRRAAAEGQAMASTEKAPEGPKGSPRMPADLKRGGAGGRGPDPVAQARQVAESLEASRASSQQHYQALAAQMPGLAPQLQAAAATSERAYSYLATKLPVSGNIKNTLTPQAEKPVLSRQQADAFLEAVRTVQDPLSVLDSLKAGKISKGQVEALKAVYPSLYGQIQTEVQAQLDARTEPLPYRKALELSTLLGVVGSPTLDPRFIKAVQASYAAPPPPPAGAPVGAASGPARPISNAASASLSPNKKAIG